MFQQVKKICHITTVHPRYDIRIYHKECLTLASDYTVCLIVADGLGNGHSNGIDFIDIGARGPRVKRILCTTLRAYRKAVSLDCDLYHFHDPEFLFYAWRLVRKGKKVIYDVHEDVPKQTLSKDYIKPAFRKVLAVIISFIENFISSRLSSIITVTESIRNRFSGLNEKCLIINNYPDNISTFNLPAEKREGVCYVGIINPERGIELILDALLAVDITFKLAGEFETDKFKKKMFSHPAWGKVKYYGVVGRGQAREIMSGSIAGLAIYLPLPNHIESQPNKLFEYMSCGTPVICSDFPLWKDVIEKNTCGLCINPGSQEIAATIRILADDPGRTFRMGSNGMKMIRDKYNWETESQKLKDLYAELLK